jgi:hypothetical protein
VSWKNTITYQLPTYSDAEGNTVTLTTVQSSLSSLPNFVTFESATRTYSINPVSSSDIGIFTISVSLSDSLLTASYTFAITVVNTAPTFASNPVAQTVNWKNSITYQLPTYSDAETNTVTLTTVQTGQAALPTFVTFDLPTRTYTLNPTAPTDIGSFLI